MRHPQTAPVVQAPRVFLFEDHPVMRRGLRELLAQQHCLICGEAERVDVGAAPVLAARPDVVLLDLSLADGDGTVLIEALHSECAELPVLVFSMHEDMLHIERALRAGARGYITKQDVLDEVIEGVRAVLKGATYLSRRVRQVVDQNDDGEGARTKLKSLSDRELEVYQLMGQGYSSGEIAKKLFLSPKTIETYCSRLKEKFGLATSRDLHRHAIQYMRYADR